MTDRDLMQQALEALEWVNTSPWLEDCYHAFDKEVTALRERLAQPEQESVKFCTYPKCQTTAGCAGVCARHNTTPQLRQWVGLTDEEINSVRHNRDWTAPWTDVTFARAIEAKLREKNHG